MRLVGNGVSAAGDGAGVSGTGVDKLVGKGVGRSTPGVGARVLLVPAWTTAGKNRSEIAFMMM